MHTISVIERLHHKCGGYLVNILVSAEEQFFELYQY